VPSARGHALAVAGPVGFFDMMVVWLGWPDSCGRQAAIAPASLNFQFPGFAEALAWLSS